MKTTFTFLLRQSIVSNHPVLAGWRTRGMHAWKTPDTLPQQAIDFLGATRGQRLWTLPEWIGLGDIAQACNVKAARFPLPTELHIDCDVDVPPPRKSYNALRIGRQFADYASPYEMYRAVYRHTDCGPSMGVETTSRTLYCDRLRELGTWEDMVARDERIYAFIVSSIVEGSDAEVPAVTVPAGPDMEDRFFDAVEDVNRQACDLWEEANLAEEDEA